MDDYKFKRLWKKLFNEINEKRSKQFNCWGFCQKNGLYGILDEFLNWCWRNSPNTNPYCLFILVQLYEEFTGNKFEVKNQLYYRGKIEKLLSFVDENWELFFTKNIETKYFHRLELACNKSWSTGQITSISTKIALSELFSEFEIISIECDLERGNPDDFIGKDIIFKIKDGGEYAIQVKSGSFYFDEINDVYVVRSSVNDLQAKCDFYCFVDTSKDSTKFIVFYNDTSKIKKEDNRTFFKKETFKISMTKNIQITQKLMEILLFCGDNKVLFNLTNTESENNVEIVLEPEKTFNVSISNFEDQSLLPLLEQKFTELNNLFE
jgi:hypothetical protein